MESIFYEKQTKKKTLGGQGRLDAIGRDWGVGKREIDVTSIFVFLNYISILML